MYKKALIWILLILLLSGGFYAALQWLNLETIRANRDLLTQFTRQHYWLMLSACGVVYCISTLLSLPGGVLLSLLVGFLFGRWAGTLLIVVSATLGATALFWLARYLFAEAARRRIMGNATAAKLLQGFHDDAYSYLLFLRLVPVFPFWLVNLVPALMPVSTRVYVLTTFIGILPGSFVFANLGQSLAGINSLRQLLNTETLLAFALLGLLALLPVFVKRLPTDRQG